MRKAENMEVDKIQQLATASSNESKLDLKSEKTD